KTSIFSHPVYLFLRKFSLQDSRGGSKIYGTREEARSDIFDYIEMFYNSKRRHGSSDQMSPTEYENQYYQRLGSV
ncbi:IS3 family transposase, partial [Escherichia coli]|uniref:IS3 family transposase n=1 Tax=Escherichia coli TaxID=562 RepID=UPI001FCEAC24